MATDLDMQAHITEKDVFECLEQLERAVATEPLPASVSLPELASFGVPDAAFLAERAGTR